MKNRAPFCLLALLLIGIFGCGGTGNQGLFSVTECEGQGGSVVLSNPHQPASCLSGEQLIGTIETPNFSGICCKPNPVHDR